MMTRLLLDHARWKPGRHTTISRGMRRHVRRILTAMFCAMSALGVTACDSLVSSPSIPEGTQSPSTYHTRQGALELTRLATNLFKELVLSTALVSGRLTDELTNISETGSTGADEYDTRELPENSDMIDDDRLYSSLHKLRGQARLARGVLAEYAPDVSPGVRAQLYAFEAYADLLLADLYCSGTPLSILEFDGDFSYRSPSTTTQVYEQAAALFDSALALASDSASIRTFASVGKGRALIAISRAQDAADAVKGISDTARYQTRVSFSYQTPIGLRNKFWWGRWLTVTDREGENGFPYISSRDPRTASDAISITSDGNTMVTRFPNKYQSADSTWFAVASGVEARLIEAEAALTANTPETWLRILNTLRTTGTYSSIDTVRQDTVIVRIDTAWNAGTGGVAGLRPLKDPGTKTERIRLLFDERAAWLFMTGQRQSDLRRLVRQYGWPASTVYPTGAYTQAPSQSGYYGDYIDIPIPGNERRNPLFRGCLTRD